MIQYQILQTKIITFVWQAVRRITNEILGYMGLKVSLINLIYLSLSSIFSLISGSMRLHSSVK